MKHEVVCPECLWSSALIKKGKDAKGRQRYYCKHCRLYFVDRRGEPLTPEEYEALFYSYEVGIAPTDEYDSLLLHRVRTKIPERLLSAAYMSLADLAKGLAERLGVALEDAEEALLSLLLESGARHFDELADE